jgi:hypothetical protein
MTCVQTDQKSSETRPVQSLNGRVRKAMKRTARLPSGTGLGWLIGGVGGLLLLTGCGASGQASFGAGNGSGNASVSGAAYRGRAQSHVSASPEEARFGREVCKDYDLRPNYAPNGVDDIERFLRERGFSIRREDPRRDLSYLDVTGNGVKNLRLRVATLASPVEAGRDLHEAILQHGAGSWGVHRSRLALLVPPSDTETAMDFASRSKLACWGEMMISGRDDTFVVPGGYREP